MLSIPFQNLFILWLKIYTLCPISSHFPYPEPLATSCEELTFWKRPWYWEGLGAGGEEDDRGWDGITNSMGMSLSKLREFVVDREARRAVIHGVAKSRTRLSDWTELSPWQPPLHSVSMSWLFLGSTFKWNYTVFVFLCLIDFTSHNILPGFFS